MSKIWNRPLVWIVPALLLGAGLKVALLAASRVPFNADEAVVALMARHILQGSRPVFFYGQFYMGSLDAFLVAGGFATFGEQVWVIRLVQIVLYSGTLLTTAWLGKETFGSWQVGALAALLMAIPTVNVTLYTTISLGGYGEALLIGNLILLCGLFIGRTLSQNGRPASFWIWLTLGFLAGLGLWAFGMTLIYSLPVFVYLSLLAWRVLRPVAEPADAESGISPARSLRQKIACVVAKSRLFLPALMGLAIGGLAGSAPWLGYAIKNGFQKLLYELGGGAIAGVVELPWIFQVGHHLGGFLLLGLSVIFGLRPPWSVAWLGLPLIPFTLFFWAVVIVFIVQSLRHPGPQRGAQAILVGVMVALLAAFIFTPFGVDPSGRYFVPLAAPLSLFAAAFIMDATQRWGRWAWGLAALVLIFQLWGNLQSAANFPPGITTQFYTPSQVDHRAMPELIEFLSVQGERRGYTNYWVTYPLAFLSQEQLIFIPRLPYHLDFRYTPRDDRYPPYDEQVERAERVAYITTLHPDLDQYLREHFTALGISWSEKQIGDYQVFYNLSRLVRPQEIGLGELTE